MAEDELIPPAENDPMREEENVQTVDLWRTHPSHKPASYSELVGKMERRRPENARIRRWVELADKALSDEPEDDLTPAA